MRWAIGAIITTGAAMAVPLGAQPAEGPSPFTTEAASRNFDARPHRDLPNGVRMLTGITYSVVNGYRPLRLDLFMQTAAATRPRPIVIFLHGGGWTLDPQGYEGITGNDTMAALAARGFIVVRPEYRLSSEAQFPAQLIDVKRAIRWAKTYAATYDGDPAQVMVWGSSAGGNLAALVGTTCGQAQFDDAAALPQRVGLSTPAIDAKATSCVTAAVDWYGPVNFPTMDRQSLPGSPGKHDAPDSAESAYAGCTIPQCPRDQVMAPSPLSYVSRDDAPFLIMHGKADVAVPWQQSQELHEALKKAGVPSELVLVDGANHMFNGVAPEIGQAQVETVFRFLEAHARP